MNIEEAQCILEDLSGTFDRSDLSIEQDRSGGWTVLIKSIGRRISSSSGGTRKRERATDEQREHVLQIMRERRARMRENNTGGSE